MRKYILPLALAASATASAPAMAQQAAPQAPAVAIPTLDKVLEASGVAVSGYIDMAYQHADRNIETGFSPRVFDSQNNSFVLHQFGLQVAKQPKEGIGGLVNITAGKDAQVIHSFPDPSGSMFDITQAFMQYASGPFTVMAGKFVTLQGSEVIWSPSNNNFSRSILFGAIPFTHTGVRASYAATDTITLYGGLNNGWDQLTDANKGKTLELGATLTPIKPLSITISDYRGQEPTGFNQNGTRNSFNIVATYTVIEPLTLGFEFLKVDQKNAASVATPGSIDAKYTGLAGYVSYMFMPKWRVALRLESLDDKDGFHFGFPAGTTSPTKYREYTTTVGYLVADNLELRGEVRTDRASQPVFTDGTNVSKGLTTFAVQALYKF
ncbi:MAG TPA: porin [Burkholderiales bacterium]|nr:porin [Burkholderiales bacterium]